jgi:hypothetical protein
VYLEGMGNPAKKPQQPMKPGRAHGRGFRRSDREYEKMLAAVAFMLDRNLGRQAISRALANEYGNPRGTAIPLPTVDDAIAKVNESWRDEARKTRVATKAAQRRRLYDRMRALEGEKKYREINDVEKLVGKIEGNFAPIKVEATTPPGQPIEVSIRDPRKMTTGERRHRIAELEAKKVATLAGVVGTSTDGGSIEE